MTTELHSNGRPSKSEQLGIEKTLRDFYVKGISANSASQISGFNIKTVCKYFNEWSAQIKEVADAEFRRKLQTERLRYLAVLDNQLLKLYQLEDDMEKHTTASQTASGESYRYHFRERLHATSMIFQIMDKKLELLNDNPNIDTSNITKN